MIKSFPTILKTIPAFKDSASMDIAASVVDPTLIGLSGGLIASAFILRIQQLYDEKLASLTSTRNRIEEGYADIKNEENNLLSDIAIDKFTLDEKLEILRDRKMELIICEIELKADIQKLNG